MEIEVASVAREELAEERALRLPGEVRARALHERVPLHLLDEYGAGPGARRAELGIADDLDRAPDDPRAEAGAFHGGDRRARLPPVERHARGVERERKRAERVLDETARALGDLLPEVEERRELDAREEQGGRRVVRSLAERRGRAAPRAGRDGLERRGTERSPFLAEDEDRGRRARRREARKQRGAVRERARRDDEDDLGQRRFGERHGLVDGDRDEQLTPGPLERAAHGLRDSASRTEQEEGPHGNVSRHGTGGRRARQGGC